jgi:hypothetical protein
MWWVATPGAHALVRAYGGGAAAQTPPPPRKRARRAAPTTIELTYASLPPALRARLEDDLQATKADDGAPRYVNVSRQSAQCYQVQAWSGGAHVRLATVSDPKVGALLLAAARLDVALLSRPLAAREWLLRVVADPAALAAWLSRTARP